MAEKVIFGDGMLKMEYEMWSEYTSAPCASCSFFCKEDLRCKFPIDPYNTTDYVKIKPENYTRKCKIEPNPHFGGWDVTFYKFIKKLWD